MHSLSIAAAAGSDQFSFKRVKIGSYDVRLFIYANGVEVCKSVFLID